MFDVHVPLPVSLRSPYVQVHTPRNKDQANLWGVARYGMVIGIGIGMHSETDWKWSEK